MGLRLYRNRTPALGDLERDVLECLWAFGSASAQEVQASLELARPITLSTVQSTVERLVRKGLLLREKQGRAYRYAPALSRSTLLARMVAELVTDLSDGGAVAGAGIVDLSQAVDDDTLGFLEQWVTATRHAREGGEPQ